ncbi:aminopeptidase Y precursor vacuolar [Fusarium acutatum]|uniref:Peptide hydrolase n=1 Tax=Fusarium acutatum TaxID=78861 RepID=A0A8H4JAX2_9HYPO|nr:aminopeptidase Y precursor vacuolar [Fusarium acutatum]
MQLLEPGADRTLYSRTDTRAKLMEAFLLRPKSSICDKVREMCFAIGLVDQATLNLALAETALYSNEYTGDMHSGREDSTALKHYNLSLRFTSQKIQTSNSVPSDEILITVIGLANYDMSIGKVDRYSTHLAGLETLPEPPIITHVLAKTLNALRDLSPVLSDLCSVLLSLTRVAKASQHWEESTFRYCETILHSSYFLLLVPRQMPSEGPEGHTSGISLIHQAIRLAALRFLVTAAEHSHHTLGAIQYRKPQLSDLLADYEISWDGLEVLQVWVLVIAVVTEGTHDRSWMIEKIAITIERLGLTWIELKGTLRQLAWVDSFESQFNSEMKVNVFIRAFALFSAGACAYKQLTPQRVADDIKAEDLDKTLRALYKIALDNSNNRAFGLPGYKASLDFVLARLGGGNHFDITVQPFKHLFSQTRKIVLTRPDEEHVDAVSLQYNHATPLPGGVAAPLALIPIDGVRGSGCFEDQWKGIDVEGKVALIKCGKCQFANKLKLAKDNGASAAIVFNDNPNQTAGSGSLGAENFGKLAPVGVVTYDKGNSWAERLKAGENLKVNLTIDVLTEKRETWQIIADTKVGNSNSVVMLGAHLDSMQEGPGINDNGSGVAALLNIADSVKKYKNFKNKLRFAFWGAEESGMIGSTYYVSNLSMDEPSKIRFYYNYDVIASPQPYYIAYADSDAHKSGARYLYEFLTEKVYPAEYIAFGASSDYVGFLELGIPSSGIFTGAGAPQDACYHTPCDDIKNINQEAFLVNAKAAGYAAASLALSVDELFAGIDNAEFPLLGLKGF